MSRKKKKKHSRSRRINKPKQNLISKPFISLCMIVKNEEKFLADCLSSVESLVGEMVIVDTGSTDETINIARKYKASVFNYDWNDDFSQARNFALEKCKGPWILYLDADERLPGEYHDLLISELQQRKFDAFYLNIHSQVSGILGDVAHIQAYPRLFRKMKGVHFEGKVHEQITPSLKRVNARFNHLEINIEHDGYAQNDEILQKKIQRNLKYLQEQILQEPDNAYAHFQLGQTLILNKKYDEGRASLIRAIQFNSLPNNLKASAWLILANEHYKNDEIEDCLQMVNRALEIAPVQRLGYFLKSECHAKLEQWPEAVRELETVRANSGKTKSDISVEKNFEEYLISQRLAYYNFKIENFSTAFTEYSEYFKKSNQWKASHLKKWAESWQAAQLDFPEVFSMLKNFGQQIKLFDNPGDAAKTLAGVAEHINESELMEEMLRTSYQWNSKDPLVLYYLGNIELQRNKFTEAEEFFSIALSLDNSVWEIHYNLAISKIKSLKFDEAAEILKNASVLFPEHWQKIELLLTKLQLKLNLLYSSDKSKVVESKK